MDKKRVIKNKSKIFVEVKIVVGILIPIIVFVILLQSVLSFRNVPTASMAGTIEPGDITITNKLAYKSREIKRKDVVLVNEGGNELEKRIIGLPGETVTFSEGMVYINGVVLEESYLKEGVKTECEKTFTVPENSYFLLGDNRDNSSDSRNWKNPYVKKENILGRTYVTMGFKNGVHIRLL